MPLDLIHYLNQYWLLISEVLWHSPENNFTASAQASSLQNEFENYTFKITGTGSATYPDPVS